MSNVLYWSKGSDPKKFPDLNNVGIHGLTLSQHLFYSHHYAEFRLGPHRCLISLQQIVLNGTDWANRKLYRFRRYARRMSR